MNDYEVERLEEHMATPGEAMEEWRFNAGADRPNDAWMLHDNDVWLANPHYNGPPVPHPEFYEPEPNPLLEPLKETLEALKNTLKSHKSALHALNYTTRQINADPDVIKANAAIAKAEAAQ